MTDVSKFDKMENNDRQSFWTFICKLLGDYSLGRVSPMGNIALFVAVECTANRCQVFKLKLGHAPTETIRMVRKAFGNYSVSEGQVEFL